MEPPHYIFNLHTNEISYRHLYIVLKWFYEECGFPDIDEVIETVRRWPTIKDKDPTEYINWQWAASQMSLYGINEPQFEKFIKLKIMEIIDQWAKSAGLSKKLKHKLFETKHTCQCNYCSAPNCFMSSGMFQNDMRGRARKPDFAIRHSHEDVKKYLNEYVYFFTIFLIYIFVYF